MLKKFYLLTSILITFTLALHAQDAAKNEVKEGWTRGAGMGADLAQLFQLNPRQGAGQNRIGIGGAANYFANYKKGRIAWDNNFTLAIGVQRLGSGFLPGIVDSANVKVPFEKNIDELRINSKIGYKLKEDSKFFIASDFVFLSQLLPTYTSDANANVPKGNYLTDVYKTKQALSKFLSPGTINFSVGIDYKPTSHFSVYFSPIGLKTILVLDDEIAKRQAYSNDTTGLGKSLFGNDWTSATDYSNYFLGVGATLKLGYQNKFLGDRITYSSSLQLFSNYLDNPQNIDVDWVNNLGFNIYKGFSLGVTLNAFYDHDVFVQISDREAQGGYNGSGRRVSLTEQILLKYNIVF
ncbi:MAG: DUF3078 domain-containing protein [Saprospiraceae bacterium]|nr:DUF3078 domain-containing protein [Saprospiraceae bacterium]